MKKGKVIDLVKTVSPITQYKKREMFTLSKSVVFELDSFCKKNKFNKSEFVENLLKSVIFTEVSYAKYMLKQNRLNVAHWEYQLKIAQEKQTP